jgi:DNA-directed RNA polymerase subunit E'/Rpb7
MTTRMNKFDKYKDNVIYSDCLITRTIQLSITSIDKDIYKTILQKIVDEYEGRCVVEGFIKPSSCNIMSYSSGLIKSDYIIYEVVFNCKICFPVEGMIIRCIANNITKAGIRAEIAHVKPSPAVVFITRDHHYNVDFFSTIKEGDMFEASVIGQRFELNDKFVSIIAKLKEPKKHESKTNAPVIIDSSEELKSNANKKAVLKAYEKWVEIVRPITECHAYTKDVKCATEMEKTKDCKGKGAKSDCCADIADYKTRNDSLKQKFCSEAPPKVPPCPQLFI